MKKLCLLLCLFLPIVLLIPFARCENDVAMYEAEPAPEEIVVSSTETLAPVETDAEETAVAEDETVEEGSVPSEDDTVPQINTVPDEQVDEPVDQPVNDVGPQTDGSAELTPELVPEAPCEGMPEIEITPEAAAVEEPPIVCHTEDLEIGVGESVSISADGEAAITSGSGVVALSDRSILGKKPGTAIVTVTGEDAVTRITVTVLKRPKKIGLSLPKTALSTGDRIRASVTYAKGYGGSYTLTSSDGAVLSVDPDGTVTAVGPGRAYVIATSYNGRTQKCQVTVKALPAGYTMSHERLVLGVGQTMTVKAVPTNDCYPDTVWSSSAPQIVSVVNGKLTARAEGTAQIRAEAFNGVMGVCEVTVVAAPTALTVADKTITLAVGERAALGVSADCETELTYRFSSKRVRMDADGMLTAVSAGTCTVTVGTFNGLKATVKVIVRKVPTSVALPASLCMEEGSRRTLAPVFRSGQGGSYTMVSSDETVLRVSGSTVEALSAGDAVCTLTTFNGLTARCEIHVYASAAETTMPETLLLGLGESCSPDWQVLGSDGKPYEGSISTAFSVKGILSVSGGRITAAKKGRTVLTVTAGALKRTCAITVDDYSVVHPAQASAHRGGFSDITENTLAAFSRAAELGAKSVEIDVQSTKDGVQIINHDTTVLGDDGSLYPVGSYTYAELKARKKELCTLKEALELLHSLDMQVFVELKETANVERCLDIVRAEAMGGKAVVYSGDSACSASIRDADPDVSMAYVYKKGDKIASIVKALEPTAMLIRYDRITTALVTSLHKLGVAVMVYTVKTESLLSEVLRYGADYILMNYPEWLL